MRKFIAGLILAATFTAGSAAAQTCSPTSLPYSLTPNTPALANQVMADVTCPVFGLAQYTGHVGIGTTTPDALLEINSGSSGAAGLNVESLLDPSVVVIDNSGNQGILSLTVATQAGNFSNIAAAGDAVVRTGANAAGAGGNLVLTARTATGSILFSTQAPDTEKMVITNAGNVGIGTAAPATTFYVNGSSGGAQGWNQSSDARLKKNVTDLSGALDLVERLRGVRFQWRTVDERTVGKALVLPVGQPQVGFIAQEVANVVPEAVTAPKPGSNEIYTLKESDLIPVLVEAIKQQQREIRAQQGEIDQLKAELHNGSSSVTR